MHEDQERDLPKIDGISTWHVQGGKTRFELKEIKQ
jgi:hypothetical protein